MPVKITTGSQPKVLPAMKSAMDDPPPHMPKTLKRDLRPDPTPDSCKKLSYANPPTKELMMQAWNALLPLVNLVPYYTESWSAVFKRHGAMLDAIYAGKTKEVKGLCKQIVDAYKKIMKTGKWQPGVWGEVEPK